MNEKEIVELRSLRRDNRSLMNYIQALQARGSIPAYKSADGYAAYCPAELEEWKKTARRGRPLTRKIYKGE